MTYQSGSRAVNEFEPYRVSVTTTASERDTVSVTFTYIVRARSPEEARSTVPLPTYTAGRVNGVKCPMRQYQHITVEQFS